MKDRDGNGGAAGPQVDPAFVGEYLRTISPTKSSYRDWRLLPGSPLQNEGFAGTTSAFQSGAEFEEPGCEPLQVQKWDHEQYGNLRVVDGAPDIGFDEVQLGVMAGSYANNSYSHNRSGVLNPFVPDEQQTRFLFMRLTAPDGAGSLQGRELKLLSNEIVAGTSFRAWTNPPGSLPTPTSIGGPAGYCTLYTDVSSPVTWMGGYSSILPGPNDLWPSWQGAPGQLPFPLMRVQFQSDDEGAGFASWVDVQLRVQPSGAALTLLGNLQPEFRLPQGARGSAPATLALWRVAFHDRVTLMLLSTFLASVMFASGSSLVNGEEWLYAQTGNGWQVYDPETGEHLQSWYVPTLTNNQGLLYHDGRLYTLNMNLVILRDFMVEVHPATSRYEEIGQTGLSFSAGYVSLVRDPTRAKSYVQANDLIYELDMKSGVLSFLSRIEQGIAIITAIAINSEGRAYGASTPSIYDPEAALYEVDVRTGQLHRIGDLQPTPITFKTLAFDGQDRLWGSGYGPFSFQKHRLYRIDLGTLQFQSAFPFPTEFPGVSAIAFGPKPDVTSYCEPKTNSAGCAPAIGWKGHPSASAHFGFEVRAAQVVPDSPGFLMLGLGGQASVPFQGGTLCVAEPMLRTTPQVSGSAVGCSSSWSLDVNTWLVGNHPLAPGDRFTCQWWGRDPGLTGPESRQLSDALEVVLLP